MANRYEDDNRARGRSGERGETREEYERNQYGRDNAHSHSQGRNEFDEEGRQNRGEWGSNRHQFAGDQERDTRDYQPRRYDMMRPHVDWGRERTGREGPWGTGSQGFGTGPRSAEFSSTYTGTNYTGYGTPGSSSYSGGMGTYAERGRHSGKGPKGYRRSDDRVREDVCERLTEHPEIDASEIEVTVKDGDVTLMGTVDDRNAKRMAEDVAESVSGVKDVHNQVRVGQSSGAERTEKLTKHNR